ncbi:emp24/gp25L/p24 family/GOLD family protein [Babesia bovis T2Bo]|uniref:Membrane protein, putative n=1 Tax=Babesia bovis TaxID=5865 RepID=A7ANR1_BABBO|nr:emp24/gp25L/p24 family/GOLD family protein [Babesia bovis T2Bo]EDO08195.1 emp24/gp25L/p24 family/GOLD family protein [Babesia bovis T2Bo]|eukprot:XP_001611763.1 membrane protein [Babesia bovis T2Bo]
MVHFTAFRALVAAALAAYIGFEKASAGFLDVTTRIKAGQKVCLVEPISKEMYTHITVRPIDVKDNMGVAVVIREEGGDKPIYEESNLMNHLSVSFTAVHGLSVVCCISASKYDIYVALAIKSGADARDYSIIAKSSHMDPVDAHLQNAIDEFSAFHKAQITGSRAMDRTSKRAADAYRLLTKFAIANSVFVVICTICFILYFRSFFLSKKVM